MKLSQIIKQFECRIYTPDLIKDIDINYGFCSDLMSDALMIINRVNDDAILNQTMLITGLSTQQSIRTAEMLDVNVVLLVRGKIPSVKVIELAYESQIILIASDQTMFNTSGLLYQQGIKGITFQS